MNGSTGTMSPYRKRSVNRPTATVAMMKIVFDRHFRPTGGFESISEKFKSELKEDRPAEVQQNHRIEDRRRLYLHLFMPTIIRDQISGGLMTSRLVGETAEKLHLHSLVRLLMPTIAIDPWFDRCHQPFS